MTDAPPPMTGQERQRAEVAARFDVVTLVEDDQEAMQTMRTLYKVVALDVVNNTVPSREQALALTALEEAKFWTSQALARYGRKTQ